MAKVGGPKIGEQKIWGRPRSWGTPKSLLWAGKTKKNKKIEFLRGLASEFYDFTEGKIYSKMAKFAPNMAKWEI